MDFDPFCVSVFQGSLLVIVLLCLTAVKNSKFVKVAIGLKSSCVCEMRSRGITVLDRTSVIQKLDGNIYQINQYVPGISVTILHYPNESDISNILSAL